MFCLILGLDRTTAEQILHINNNNLERAINFHLEGHPDQINDANEGGGSVATAAGPSSAEQIFPNMPELVSNIYLFIYVYKD